MFTTALQILKAASKPGQKIARDTVKFSKLMEILDYPYRSYKCIHITGTNGKGSVSLKIAKCLQQCGLKVGLYTSPHLFTILQRIQINRSNIEARSFAQLIIKLEKISKNEGLNLTFFEYLTAAGFMHFKQQQCQVASIEVGLGGRYDTTNVITPILSVITSIGHDHEKILGQSLTQIAYEKAGIIKRGIPVILGPTAQLQPIQLQSYNQNAMIYKVKTDHIKDFNEENNEIVKKCIQILNKNNQFKISQQCQKQGLEIKQPYRMQRLNTKLIPVTSKCKQIIFDVGHNPSAINRMLQYLFCNIKPNSFNIIFGCSKGKNALKCLLQIQQYAQIIYLVSADHERAMKIQELQNLLNKINKPNIYRIIKKGNIKQTINQALCVQNTLIICGSFFIMPQVYNYFEPSFKINQEILGENENIDKFL